VAPDTLSHDERTVLAEGSFQDAALAAGNRDPIEVAAAEYAILRRKSLSTSEVAALLGLTDGRVRQRLIAQPPSLLGFKEAGDWRVYHFQFEQGTAVPGIEQVVARLRPGLNPVAICRWFTTPNPDLVSGASTTNLTPLQWLRIGEPVEIVARLAGDL